MLSKTSTMCEDSSAPSGGAFTSEDSPASFFCGTREWPAFLYTTWALCESSPSSSDLPVFSCEDLSALACGVSSSEDSSAWLFCASRDLSWDLQDLQIKWPQLRVILSCVMSSVQSQGQH